jgi:hypothetical protein
VLPAVSGANVVDVGALRVTPPLEVDATLVLLGALPMMLDPPLICTLGDEDCAKLSCVDCVVPPVACIFVRGKTYCQGGLLTRRR